MIASNPLATLRDIHLPDPVAVWPPAIGWWVIAAMLAVALYVAMRVGWRWQLRWRQKRYALRLLSEIERDASSGAAASDIASRVLILLKRVAMLRFSRTEMAGLSGRAWIVWLQEQLDVSLFSPEITEVWMAALYGKAAPPLQTELFAMTRQAIGKLTTYICESKVEKNTGLSVGANHYSPV